MKRYYSLYQNGTTADIYIYGDIVSWEWFESDVSSYTLSKELQELEDVDNINVYISSYGGEVKEGLAIYNALKRHKAKITTIADGFACSIASVIFAAGDERIMSNTSLLMIHNAWSSASGDSNDFKKQAEDLEKITQASINAYMNIVSIEEEELKEMMNIDTWIDGVDALEMGFATQLVEEDLKDVATQSIRKELLQRITKEPEKVAIANISFSKKDMEEIVQKEIQKLEKRLQVISNESGNIVGTLDEIEKLIEEKEENTDNKPLNMMRALFNSKEEK